MRPLRTSRRFKLYRQARQNLCRAYPGAFPRRGCRPPLKIGILKDIISDGRHGLTSGQVRLFLSIWTRSTSYLVSLSKEGERIGLDGRPLGSVEGRHAAEARAIVGERRRLRRERKAIGQRFDSMD